MKYIPADKLIAEIEGRIKLNQMMLEKDSRPSDYGRIEEGRYILRFVERIQQEHSDGVDGVVHHALKSEFHNFKVLELRAFKVTSYIGDKQVMLVSLCLDEKGEPYYIIEIRTLTKTPEKYGYNAILRRINGYFYILNSYGMRVAVWSAFFMAVGQMKDAATDAMADYINKKEKPNGE